MSNGHDIFQPPVGRHELYIRVLDYKPKEYPKTPYDKQIEKLVLRYFSQDGIDKTEIKPHMMEFWRGVRWAVEYLHNHGINAS